MQLQQVRPKMDWSEFMNHSNAVDTLASHCASWREGVDHHPLHEIHRRFRRMSVGMVCPERMSTRFIHLLVQLGSFFLSTVGRQSFLWVSRGQVQLRLWVEN